MDACLPSTSLAHYQYHLYPPSLFTPRYRNDLHRFSEGVGIHLLQACWNSHSVKSIHGRASHPSALLQPNQCHLIARLITSLPKGTFSSRKPYQSSQHAGQTRHPSQIAAAAPLLRFRASTNLSRHPHPPLASTLQRHHPSCALSSPSTTCAIHGNYWRAR